MERIIARSELATDEGSASLSPEPESIERVKTLDDFEFIDPSNQDQVADKAEDDEDELDFRLFASTGLKIKKDTKGPAVTKIKLRSPTPVNAEPGFTNPLRNPQYYFTNPPSELEREQFDVAAISGVDVMRRSSSAWPGCSYSWKVLNLPTTKQNRALLYTSEMHFKNLLGNTTSSKHRRPGKKARIRMRIKHEAIKERREEQLRTAEEKATTEREKRNRRNREKKIKRRARDRARKAGTEAEVDSSS